MNPYLNTHTAIVGASGAGKTVTAKDQVEELLRAGRHVCVLDPTGAWYGLRSNAAGDGPGFDIPIFGGAHGDVPITADQGEAIGAIVAERVSAIVDISGLRTGSEQRHFARDLCRRLRGKPSGNFHMVVDEADEFASQKPRDDYAFQVGEELIWMAKRGRLDGFVLTLITQRPASIDKEVLTQAQTLIIHQLLAPIDQKPIIDYLKDHADKPTLTSIKNSLASLGQGERWIYSPRLGVLERGVSPVPTTFDSSRTPEPGEEAVEPKMLAEIDLGAIRTALAPEVPASPSMEDDEAGRSAATHLLAPYGRLEAEIASLRAERDEWVIDRSYGQQQIEALTAENRALRDIIQSAWADVQRIRPALEQENSPGGVKREAASEPSPNAGGGHVDGSATRATDLNEGRRSPDSEGRGASPPALRRRPSSAIRQSEGQAPLNASARKMLDMLERIAPAKVTWTSLAAMVGNKARGGNFNAARKAMRESGRIAEEGDTIRASFLAVGGMTRDQALILWKDVLANPAPRMIDALHVKPMTRTALGDFLGLVPRGGNFNNGVAQLVRNGVAIERDGRLELAAPLPGETR